MKKGKQTFTGFFEDSKISHPKKLLNVTDINLNSNEKSSPHKQNNKDTDREGLIFHIKNLEKTLAINKQIINDLCAQSKENTASQKIIEDMKLEISMYKTNLINLEQENKNLNEKVLQNDQNNKISDQKSEDKLRLLEDKLNKITKELAQSDLLFQSTMYKLIQAITLLKKFCINKEEVQSKIKEFQNNQNVIQMNMANLMEENDNLKSRLNEANLKLDEFARELMTSDSVKNSASSAKLRQYPIIPRLNLDKINNGMNNTEYCHKLEENIKYKANKISKIELELKIVNDEKKKSHDKIIYLFQTNKKLCELLSVLNKKFRALSNSKEHFLEKRIIEKKEKNGQNEMELSILVQTTKNIVEEIMISNQNDCDSLNFGSKNPSQNFSKDFENLSCMNKSLGSFDEALNNALQ